MDVYTKILLTKLVMVGEVGKGIEEREEDRHTDRRTDRRLFLNYTGGIKMQRSGEAVKRSEQGSSDALTLPYADPD